MQSMLVSPLLPLAERRQLQGDYFWLYVSLIIVYFLFIIIAVVLLFKSPFTMNRYLEDECIVEFIDENQGL